MEENIIRSHRARVVAVKYTPLRISPIDKEAFVEFLLLEDIVRLYTVRLENEREKSICYP